MSYVGNSMVEMRRPQKSSFDLSERKRITTRMGRLTPILIKEAIPGDRFSGGSEVLLRLAPLLAPIYDDITLFVHYFFVPNRLLWSEWEPFITGGRLGVGIDPAVAPIPPYVDLGFAGAEDPLYFAKSSLSDYLGVPVFPDMETTPEDYDGINIDVMPYLVYQKVWDDYYRDRNYIADGEGGLEFPFPSGNNNGDTPVIFALKTRDYLKEYFTAALPFTQRGVEVLMPLSGTGTVTYLDTSLVKNTAGAQAGDGELWSTAPNGEFTIGATSPTSVTGRLENIDEVELTSSDVSINDLRSAVRLQEWLERNAVGGSRYTESIQAHFAEKPQDSRLQRAEYIGGGKIPVRISEVVNMAFSKDDADATVPAGTLSGHGVTYGNTNRFRYACPEHGFIIGIMSIMAKPSYYQGLPRMFKRPTFLDYPWPTFAKLGEQRVEKWELFANPATMTEDADGLTPLFGYQSRYADWKQGYDSSHGEFRDTLKFWTLVRTFADAPELGATFVNFDQSTQNGIFAVNGTGDNFWCYVHNQVKVNRCLPLFGTPTL